jgi:type IV secretory pathway VirB10-like protein
VIVMRVLHPSVARLVGMVPQMVGWIVMGVLYAVYAADLVATTVTAKRLSRELDALEEVAESIHVVSDALTQVLGVKALESDQKLDEGKLQLKLAAAEARSVAQRRTAEGKEKLSSRAAAARTHEMAQSAMRAAGRAAELARQSAAGAANAARHVAVGTAERTKEIVTQQVDLEQMKAELTARSEAMQAHLLQSHPMFGSRRLLRAFPTMKHGKHNLSLSHFSLTLRRGKAKAEPETENSDTDEKRSAS